MTYYYATERGNDLRHFGIKGQKWGIRRYQNPDGTLTPEGKIRYGYDESTGKMSKEGAKTYGDDYNEGKKKYDSAKTMAKTSKIISNVSKYINIGSTLVSASGVAAGIIDKKYELYQRTFGVGTITGLIGSIASDSIARYHKKRERQLNDDLTSYNSEYLYGKNKYTE